MGDKEWEPKNLLDVFGDHLARRILVLASDRPVSADDLGEHLEASQPTIYRRVNTLTEYDLLAEKQEVDADGHHYKTFETRLKQVRFGIEDEGYTIDLRMRQDLVDRFDEFWSDLEAATPRETSGSTSPSNHDRSNGGAPHD